MGWTLQGVQFQHQGVPTQMHADGNNAAWVCPKCKHPVLFVYQNGRSGSGPNSRTYCPGCPASYHLSPPFTRPEPPAGNPVQPAPIMQVI